MKYYLGIDLGGTNIAFGIADENRNFIAKHSIKTNAKRDYLEIVEDMAKTSLEILENNNISKVESIGIGVPGIVDLDTKKIVISGNLGWYDVDLVSDFKKNIDAEVYIANDADAATFGELLVSENIKSMAMLTLGTGVGSGVTYENKIFGGGDNVGFELGHLILVPNGIKCSCGNQGCTETYVSTTALIRMAKENLNENSQMYGKDIDGKVIFECAKNKDETALKVLDMYTDYLAIVCYNTIMSYRTDALMIGGGISVQEELLINPLREKVRKLLEPMGNIQNTPILCARLGNDAGILGACFLKLNNNWK